MRIRDINDPFSGTKSNLSRRLFFGAAAGAGTTLGAAGLQRTESEDYREQPQEFRPNAIPGGFGPLAPFGIFIHHLPITPGGPLANINDPSNITNFRGFVGITRVRGGGVGTNTVTGAMTNLAFQADMGFNQGHFVGTDGQQHEGSFAFVWLDLYTGPVGSANLTDQIHDYNPHIDSDDVFWTVPIPQREVTVDFEDAIARLRVRRLAVFDDHDLANSLTSGLGLPGDLGFSFPKISPVAPVRATVSFEIEWSSNLGEAKIHNASQGFQGFFRQTTAAMSWSAEQEGFRFDSDAANTSISVFAVIGFERNGIFFRS